MSTPILTKPSYETAEIGRGCSLQPWSQPCWIALVQEVGEGSYILYGLAELRRGAAERCVKGMIITQQGGRLGGEPPGNAARRGDPGGRRSGRRTLLPTCGQRRTMS